MNVEEPITPIQIETLLGISKVQLHHWRKLLDLKLLQPSYGKGLTTLYSRDNLFALLLLQKLFQKFGLKLPAAVSLVQRLLRDVGLDRLQELPSVTVTTSIAEEQHPTPKHRPTIVGTITIPLNDLHGVAHGPVN